MSKDEPCHPSHTTVRDRLVRFFASGKQKKAHDVQLDDEAVVIVAGPKNGTSWLQHILHSLRSRGDLDYEDIHDVSPVLELAACGVKQHAEAQKFHPPLFKTHYCYEECPSTKRAIVLARNPNDAALSLFYFFRNWFFWPDEMDLDGFIECFYWRTFSEDCPCMHAQQMRHLASWYPFRKEKNILWLHYEDLKADLPKCIRMIAEFIGVPLDEELMDIVMHQADIEFMRKHMSKFDAHKLKLARNEAAGLDKNAGLTKSSVQKVRSGNVNESNEIFSERAKQMMHEKWMELLKPVTGFDSYKEMRSAVNAELGREFPA